MFAAETAQMRSPRFSSAAFHLAKFAAFVFFKAILRGSFENAMRRFAGIAARWSHPDVAATYLRE
jgi:hypothetical protein